MTTSATFHSPTHGKLTLAEVVARITNYISEAPARGYRIAVGADSAARDTTAITSVVVVQRIGNGAMYFYTRAEKQHFASLRDRIYAEAMASITLGQELRSALKDTLGEMDLHEQRIEIHADVGYNGPMCAEIDAIKGMAKGFDFIPVIKPDAYAACAVADRHT